MSVDELKKTQIRVQTRLNQALATHDELVDRLMRVDRYGRLKRWIMMALMWTWGGLVAAVVILDELYPKFAQSVWYSLGVDDYASASTRAYQLQTPRSFRFWLPIHIISASTCAVIAAALVAASYKSFRELTPGQRRIFFSCNLIFMLTILLQIAKLSILNPVLAFMFNTPLLSALFYTAYVSRSTRQYLAVMSIPLILTAIATHILA